MVTVVVSVRNVPIVTGTPKCLIVWHVADAEGKIHL